MISNNAIFSFIHKLTYKLEYGEYFKYAKWIEFPVSITILLNYTPLHVHLSFQKAHSKSIVANKIVTKKI